MTIKVYVDWAEQEVCTDQDRDGWIKDQANGYYEDEDELNRFLNALVTDVKNPLAFLLDLNENARQEIMKKFKERCKELAIDDFDDKHEKFTVGI